jgi:hypothetical protein
LGAAAPVLVLVCAVGGVLVDLRGTSVSPQVSNVAVCMLCAATASLALVVGALLLVRWRVSGEIRSAAVGMAVLLLLGLHPAFQAAAAALGHSGPELDYTDLGVMVAGLGLLVVEQRRPEVDSKRRGLAILGLGLLIWIGASAVPMLAGLKPDMSTAGHGSLNLWSALFGPSWWPHVLFAGALVALAGPMCFRSFRRHLGVEYWVGLSLVAWTAGIAMAVLMPNRPLSPSLLAGLRGIGVLILLIALLAESASESLVQRSDLFARRVQTLATEAEQRAMREDQRSRAHQARSVVMAVRTAGRALQRGLGSLSAEDRAALTAILQEGLAEIDRYVAGDQPGELSFPAGSLVAPLRSSARLLGRELLTSIPPGLAIKGSRAAVLEAIRIAMGEVAASSAGTELKIRASTQDACICISVSSLDTPIGATDLRSDREGASSLPLELVAAEELVRRHGGRIEGRATRSGHRYVIWLVPALDSATA